MTVNKMCATCGEVFEKPGNVSRREWAKRLYCKRACQYAAMRGRSNLKLGDAHRGKQLSLEHRAKIAASYQRTLAAGKVHHARANLGLRGEQTSQWKGDDVSYRTAHARLGKPTACDLCGKTDGWLEWALKHDAAVVKMQSGGVGDGMLYSPRPEDYFPTCRPCHRVYDGRERDPRTGRYVATSS